MPVSRYYKGRGEAVMAAMKREYGAKKGERVFYATAANAQKKRRKLKRPKT